MRAQQDFFVTDPWRLALFSAEVADHGTGRFVAEFVEAFSMPKFQQ